MIIIKPSDQIELMWCDLVSLIKSIVINTLQKNILRYESMDNN